MTATLIVIGIWLFIGIAAAFSAVVLQKRSVGLSILTGLLLGPLAMVVIPRLPLRQRTPGWYPWWDGRYRHRYWNGQAWTDQYVSDWTSKPATAPRVAPPGWYPSPDGTGGQRWWNGQAWSPQPPV